MTEAPVNVDAFLEKLVALGGELVDAAKPLAKVATEATFTAIHFNGVFGLVGGLAALAVAGGCAWSVHRCAKALKEASTDDGILPLLGSLAFGIGAIIFVIGGVVTLTSADTWMALLRPDAYLAAKALGL
jgi:hypothetical protein